jgi:hypothetical protein
MSGRAVSGGSDVKLRYLLPSWNMLIFDFHGEDSGEEFYGY